MCCILWYDCRKVTWIDSDGESITVRTDEELLIALTEMEGPVYKLDVE